VIDVAVAVANVTAFHAPPLVDLPSRRMRRTTRRQVTQARQSSSNERSPVRIRDRHERTSCPARFTMTIDTPTAAISAAGITNFNFSRDINEPRSEDPGPPATGSTTDNVTRP
jgi:hypothetical protein